MSSLGKSAILLVVILAIGGGLVVWKQKYGGGLSSHSSSTSFNSISKEEMELLLKDANPMMLKQLASSPDAKKEQLESLKELLAMASAAQSNPEVYTENVQKILEIIDASVWAQSYDKQINKDKGPMPPFGFITEDQIKEFYGDGDNANAEQKRHQAEFEEFLKVQLDFARKNKSIPEDTEPTEEEKAQVKEQYAKIKIYEAEAKAKQGELGEEFVKKVELQSKLQKASFLSRIYSTDVMAKKAEITDEDVQNYLNEHPELNTEATKKAKADEVLARVKNGEDFAALAKEFSEDPGSKDKGGLYEGVTQGGFDKDFESAALALEPGQLAPEPVKTQFGYHIIKLEKKGEAKDQSGQVKVNYDVRHILFSTMYKDPSNPMGREMPIKEYIKQKLQDDREKKALEELIAANHVEVAEDFEIPQVSDAQIQEMMKKQMPQQMPQPSDEDPSAPPSDPSKPAPKKPEPKKPEPKKK